MSLRKIPPEDISRAAQVLEEAFANTVLQQVLVKYASNIPLDAPHDVAHHRGSLLPRLLQLHQAGADIVEVDGFAGIAVWFAPGAAAPPPASSNRLTREYKSAFQDIEARHGLSGVPKYSLFMVARNVAADARGVAAKLIVPYLERARREQVKVSLEAISDSSKEVYLRLGFRVVESVRVWRGVVNSKGEPDDNGEGLRVHYMLYE